MPIGPSYEQEEGEDGEHKGEQSQGADEGVKQ